MKCIVTDHVEPDLDWEREEYQQSAIAFESLDMRNGDPEALASAAADADVLVVDQAKITADVLSRLTRCKLIIRHGDGYDNLDLHAATTLGIVCANKPGFWSREVAELTLGLGLSLFLRLSDSQNIARVPHPGGGGWDLSTAMPQRRIATQTVGVVGFGRVGHMVAGLFKQVCRNVLVYDPYVDPAVIRDQEVESVEFDYLLRNADLVTVHTPATEDTLRLFDRKCFARMKPGALLVNTARGAIVDTADLLNALQSGLLGGAALDVTDPEPLPASHPLFTLNNVIITPHLGWYSEDALWAMRRSIVNDVKNAAAGRRPATVVNPEVLQARTLRFPE